MGTRETWRPPVRFYRAGRQSISSRDYRCDCRNRAVGDLRRILIKRTLAGEGVIYAAGRRIVLEPGWVFVITRPGDYLYCYEGGGEPWHFEYLSLLLPGKAEALPAHLRENPAWDASVAPGFLRQMEKTVNDILGETCTREVMVEGRERREELLLSAAAYRLFLLCVAAQAETGAHEPAAVRRLLEHLQLNFTKAIYLGELAREFGYTPEALSRLFRASIGLPPLQYLTRLRLNHARGLLETSAAPLKEIASACGFSDANYFCRAFRAHHGVSPGQYRTNPSL